MDYLKKENAEEYLKKAPESIERKQLNSYDVIVAMEQRHKDAILTKCPECAGKIVVWNVEDPYFLEHEEARRIYHQIKDKVRELAESL